jgi:phosphatidylinositol kinase/protein kinase (PI-3  family)
VSIDTWLQVIPQLIARIHSAVPSVRKLTHQLLTEVGKHHPQALVYSLTVASKSQSASRCEAARAIMDKMRLHSPRLVEQALLVSQELIRVAILWHEMWHEGLEEASRLYFGERNVAGMFAILEPLHQMLERVRMDDLMLRLFYSDHLLRARKRSARFHSTKRLVEICKRLLNGVASTNSPMLNRICIKLGICIIMSSVA